MKRQLYFLKNTAIIVLTIMLGYMPLSAATFTATTSGNWSSSATWGGTAPSFNLTTDQVVIPSGITVAMDNSVTVTGATAAVGVQGTLTSTASQSLTVNALGSLTGSGTINIGSLHLQALSVMTFSGAATVDTLTTALASLQLSGGLTVSNALNLSAGTLTLGSGGSLTLNSGGTIIMAGGSLSNNGGTLSLTASYNVAYTTASATTGIELSGSGLNNVTINVSSGNHVTLSSALTVAGTLSLTSGTLVLNGNNLTLSGSIAASGGGSVTSTSVFKHCAEYYRWG
jgi:fibronectin-binding autotransporter adhesin